MNANISTHNQTDKRYLVSVSYYLIAEDDIAAVREALHFTNKLNHKEDCLASVDEIKEAPFGKSLGKKIL